MVAQRRAFVIPAEQPAALQFGNHHLDEILAAIGQWYLLIPPDL